MGSPRRVPVPWASTASMSVGLEVGVGEGLVDDALLGGAVGGGEAVGGAVLVDGGAADDGEDGVALLVGVGEAFEEEESGAFGPAGAVGVRRRRVCSGRRGRGRVGG